MAKNDLLLLDSILEGYIAKGIPSKKPDEVFEFFATEQILKDYAFSTDQILSGSVDGRNDGGIDEFFILVNGHLAENIPEDFWPKSNAELEVYIITCKHDDSFKQAPITTMIPSLIELLDFTIPSESLKNSYNEAVLRKRELFLNTYKRLASALTQFDIHIIYACRGDESIEDNIKVKADQTVYICQNNFSDCTASFSFWGNSTFLKKYRENVNTTLELKYEQQCINQNGQYVLLATLKNYCDFITDTRGKLNRHLFDANVRDYLGLNPVNIDIATSLRKNDGPDFWWLNNGITIIGTGAHIVGNSISIENVKIVNGLQTSESIFHYFSDCQADLDNRKVLIKILIVNDIKTCNEIIYATNNQTNVNVTALRATDKTQCDIEEILKLNKIYYERRTNYYQNRGIPESAIITPLALATGFVTLIYKDPYTATSLRQKFMRDDWKYEKIFSQTTDLKVWVVIAKLLKKTDLILGEVQPTVGKNTVRFLKNYRQIVMFITVSRLMGKFSFSKQQLINFNLDLYSKEEIQKSLTDLTETDSSCFTKSKKLKHSFYVACFNYMANKYNIKDLQSISKISKKLRSETDVLSQYGLSPQIVDNVFSKLPPQPWPIHVHQEVAQHLGLKDIVVSNAISFLIFTGKVNAQIYGYVFDSNENLVIEGDHFGHTEEEARIKLQAQIAFREKKFKF